MSVRRCEWCRDPWEMGHAGWILVTIYDLDPKGVAGREAGICDRCLASSEREGSCVNILDELTRWLYKQILANRDAARMAREQHQADDAIDQVESS